MGISDQTGPPRAGGWAGAPLAARIWGRYVEAPGVIPMAVGRTLAGRSQWGVRRFPLASEVLGRWLSVESTGPGESPVLSAVQRFLAEAVSSQQTNEVPYFDRAEGRASPSPAAAAAVSASTRTGTAMPPGNLNAGTGYPAPPVSGPPAVDLPRMPSTRAHAFVSLAPDGSVAMPAGPSSSSSVRSCPGQAASSAEPVLGRSSFPAAGSLTAHPAHSGRPPLTAQPWQEAASPRVEQPAAGDPYRSVTSTETGERVSEVPSGYRATVQAQDAAAGSAIADTDPDIGAPPGGPGVEAGARAGETRVLSRAAGRPAAGTANASVTAQVSLPVLPRAAKNLSEKPAEAAPTPPDIGTGKYTVSVGARSAVIRIGTKVSKPLEPVYLSDVGPTGTKPTGVARAVADTETGIGALPGGIGFEAQPRVEETRVLPRVASSPAAATPDASVSAQVSLPVLRRGALGTPQESAHVSDAGRTWTRITDGERATGDTATGLDFPPGGPGIEARSRASETRTLPRVPSSPAVEAPNAGATARLSLPVVQRVALGTPQESAHNSDVGPTGIKLAENERAMADIETSIGVVGSWASYGKQVPVRPPPPENHGRADGAETSRPPAPPPLPVVRLRTQSDWVTAQVRRGAPIPAGLAVSRSASSLPLARPILPVAAAPAPFIPGASAISRPLDATIQRAMLPAAPATSPSGVRQTGGPAAAESQADGGSAATAPSPDTEANHRATSDAELERLADTVIGIIERRLVLEREALGL